MKTDFDVIVIGAGIYGTAIAYFLSKSKYSILLVDKNTAGSGGASRYSGGIIRLFDEDKVLQELNILGREEFLYWNKKGYPGKSPFNKTGMLHLLNNNIEYDNAVLNSTSDEILILDKKEYTNIFPYLNHHHSKKSIYEKNSGYGDVRCTIYNLIQSFKEGGGILYENCEVKSIESSKNKRCEVVLSYGKLTSSVVVVATGIFTKNLLSNIPIIIKTIPLTHIKDVTTQFSLPIIDYQSSTYLRPIQNQGFYCGGASKILDNTDVEMSYGEEEFKDSLLKLKALSNYEYSSQAVNGFIGFDAYMQNNRPVIGFSQENSGIYIATGFSGRGYKSSLYVSKEIGNDIAHYLNQGLNLKKSEILKRFSPNAI